MSATRRHEPVAALVGSIALRGGGGAALTEQRVRLLEAIDTQGSLSRAAAALPMSYKAAWDAIDELDRLADAPLVQRQAGGPKGGGTQLTEAGRRLVALYRALEQTQQSVLDRLPAAVTGDTAALRGLVRRLAVRSSARNQFAAQIVDLHDAGGRVDVELRLPGDESMRVSITPESAQGMGLAAGVQVHALIKAPWIDVLLRAPRRRDGVNLLPGRVQSLRPGRVSTQVVLRTDGGSDVVASLDRVPGGLREGVRAIARFDTHSAILLRFDA